MKTVDVRLLVADDVDPEYLARQLATHSQGAGAPLGAVLLVEDHAGRSTPGSLVYVRDGVTWSGGRRRAVG